MSNELDKRSISRRGALSVISRSVCAAVSLPRPGRAASRVAITLTGLAPAGAEQGASSATFFTKSQMETLAALSESIIPADQHSPGAKAARVDQYIDEIVGTSDNATKKFWIEGLSAVDGIASWHSGKAYVKCSPSQQLEILQELSLGEGHPSTLEERFFVAIKRATVDGYYNSEVGIHEDLQYQGNEALPEFEGCAHKSQFLTGTTHDE